MRKTTTFELKGMTCDNCVHHVTEAILGVSGVKSAAVSLTPQVAKVEGDFDVQAVIAAVDEEGYEANAGG